MAFLRLVSAEGFVVEGVAEGVVDVVSGCGDPLTSDDLRVFILFLRFLFLSFRDLSRFFFDNLKYVERRLDFNNKY